jgi:nucleoid-associated protein YgaU
MADEKKKNIFDSVVDALTNRDEKAAAEAAKQQAEAANQQAEAAKVEMEKAKAEIEQARAEADAAKKAAEDLRVQAMDQQAKAQAQLEEDDRRAELARKAQEASERAAAAAAAAVVKHVWTSEDTYASLAQKYYGSFQEPYWRLIYDHNKAIIGNHPNAIRVGLEIEIPPLPDELKKK